MYIQGSSARSVDQSKALLKNACGALTPVIAHVKLALLKRTQVDFTIYTEIYTGVLFDNG